LAAKLVAVTAQGVSGDPGRDAGQVHEDPRAIPGPGDGRHPGIIQRGTGPRNVAVEQSCAVPVAGAQEGAAARRVRISVPPSR
jgi:hypothetical protein